LSAQSFDMSEHSAAVSKTTPTFVSLMLAQYLKSLMFQFPTWRLKAFLEFRDLY